jgi:hypothetical protein
MARSRKEEKMSCDQNDHAIGDILTEISSMTINDFQNKIDEYRIKEVNSVIDLAVADLAEKLFEERGR